MRNQIFKNIGIGAVVILGTAACTTAIVGITTVGISKMIASAAIITVGCCVIAGASLIQDAM
jgi:hypothetical protein